METQPLKLAKVQQQIYNYVEANSTNVLIIGPPGTGKSVLINALRNEGKKFYHIAAPTGLAALNVKGKTIHSLFRLPVSAGIIAPDYDVYPTDEHALGAIRTIKHLIIDEISMMRSEVFEYIDRLFQYAKGSSEPFGGTQMILVGDFYQLPPVVVGDEVRHLKEHFGSPFIFTTDAFKRGFKIMTLSEVLRQKGDDTFINILHEARTGMVTPKSLKLLNNQIHPGVDDIRIRLVATNKQSQAVNELFLNKIEEEAVNFTARSSGNWPQKPVEELLTLKVGAQVMVKKNGADIPPGKIVKPGTSRVVNGTLGVIVEIKPEGDEFSGGDGTPYVLIEMRDGEEVRIYWARWEYKVKERDEITGKWTEKVLASFEQMPLSLAWATTMHKSQGQSFDAVHIDASKVFAPGQLYVALSRCRSLAGVTLEGPLQARQFFVNPDVFKFFETLED